jgi:hypothetical protein
MRRTILNILMALSLTLMPPTLAFGTAYAKCPGGNDSRAQVLKGLGETTKGNCKDTGVNNIISTVVNILSIVVGAVAIIQIIVAGFKYITSGGDSNKVGNAKNTLIYALVGLAIAALAQALVHFVLHESIKAIK